MEKKHQYDWLDLIRGMAALAVFTGHLRIICFRDVEVGTLNLAGKATFFLTGFGHLAVIIFFVLSGFLIIKSIHESVLKNKWDTVNYAQNRFFRLWVVLVPCLILGLIIDKIGIQYYGHSLFYSNQWKYFIGQDIENKLTATIFIGNALFVQKILVPTLGSNAALWSLANEFWYYVIFPLFYFASIDKVQIYFRILFALLGIGLLFFVGKEIAITFPMWLAGGLSYIIVKKIDQKYLENTLLMIVFVGLFLLSMLFNRMRIQMEFFNFYTISFLFALAIPFLINISMKNNLVKAISTYFSNISYTLYLAHLPIIYLVTSAIDFQDKMWSTRNFVLFLILTIGTLAYSTLIWYLFERNTKQIKAWITNDKGSNNINPQPIKKA
jgi:peptidoglycan/LPS O-acetylase OafA/YrhL